VLSTPDYSDASMERQLQGDSLIRKARELGPLIRGCRDEIDSTRQLPMPLIEALRAGRFFRLFVPAKFGGYEVDPITFVKIVEEISAVDGSAGWVVSVCAVGGLIAGFLGEEAAGKIYGDNQDSVVAGGINPTGRAVAKGTGYTVAGKWAFGSGIRHADWAYGNCVVYDGEQARFDKTGKPVTRLMLFPIEACEIYDTWHVGGLRGTGSHDFGVKDLFVPEELSVMAFAGKASQPGNLFKFPFSLFAVLIAAVPLGIARGAISALVELAKVKKPTGASSLLSEKPSAQIAVARAEALLGSGRAFLFEALSEMGNEIAKSGEADMRCRAALRLACTQAAINAGQAVDLMFEAGGATSVYTSSSLERCFRDVHVATQHIAVSSTSLELSGRVILGLDPGTARF
jgi:alkylation response protein AidB-like acyl-CoA dehydrogenase